MVDRSTAAARPGHEIVEHAALSVIRKGLGAGESAFTPGRVVWSGATADELHHAFVERPITGPSSFLEKLHHQLGGVSPNGVQLAAELLYLNVLPLNNVYGRTKRHRIETVLSWLPDPPPLPRLLDDALDHGVLHGGVGFNVHVWSQLAYLIRFVRHWFRLPRVAQMQALQDPWEFRERVDEVVPAVPSQRGVLLYLVFPTVFEAIAQVQHKKQIRRAYADLVPAPSGDLDRDLAVIRKRLQAESETPVHFYFSPWRDRWLPAKPGGQRAWLVRSESVDVLDRWLAEHVVELAVGFFGDLPIGVPLGDVERAVELAHPYLDYVARQQIARDAHAMLSMKPGDLVVTVADERLWLGTITSQQLRYERNPERTLLARAVDWHGDPIDTALLPAAARAHLAMSGEIVDLTEDVPLLAGLLAETAFEVDDVAVLAVDDAVGVISYDGAPTLREPDQDFADSLHMPLTDLVELTELISDRQQVILFGPPGTGKTYLARKLASYLAEAADDTTDRVVVVQFHPSTTYEDFFEGYRPAPDAVDGQLRFELQPGPLTRLVSRARQDPQRPYFMVIDEINRANLAKVFGELYFLLEYRGAVVNLLYRPDKPFTMPENVYFIGTMNTVDRSVVDVDAAMRRRFAFYELHPDKPPVAGLLERWLSAGDKSTERAELLDELNRRIGEYDLKVGPAYLMKKDADREDGLDRVWRYSILPLLVEQNHGRLTPEQVEETFGLDGIRAEVTAERERR